MTLVENNKKKLKDSQEVIKKKIQQQSFKEGERLSMIIKLRGVWIMN